MTNFDIIREALPNRINAAYRVIRQGDPQDPELDCRHDWVEYTQEQKWGNIDWMVCLSCGGVKQGKVEDITAQAERQNRKINYQTRHAGHSRGARIETGPPTMGGRDYER